MSVAQATQPQPRSANPRHRRPARYLVAAVLGALLFLALVGSSSLSYLSLDRIPSRGLLLGLPAVALVAGATWIGIRAVERDSAERRRHQLWAVTLLALAILLWLLLLDVFLFTEEAGPGATALSTLACLPTTAAGLWVVRRLDREQKEPWRLVLVATLWGAVVATSLVLWAEEIFQAWAVNALVPGHGLEASNAFSAGVVEELAKGSALLLLYLVMRDEFNDVVDGIVYGAAVGLGFNFMETIGYMTYLDSLFGPYAAGFQWYHRQVLDLFFGHASYTALVGAGIGIARQLPGRRRQVIAITSGFLAAIAAHFAWDAWLTFFPLGTGAFTLVQVHLRVLAMNGPFTAVVVVLLLMGRRIEGRSLERQLALEAASGSGAILAEEVAILCSPGRRLRARLAAGPRGYVRLARLQRAQVALALERWQRERRGIDEPLAAEHELRRRVLELRVSPPAAAPTGPARG
ncbi:MAG TPA: PrsW family intramembrane metalloprotease [Candidatus Dormibacteraeota bacterium]|nr:PrsW family intramembrane metalloprotease [Candidatus Dormibacteraeota bacterium]